MKKSFLLVIYITVFSVVIFIGCNDSIAEKNPLNIENTEKETEATSFYREISENALNYDFYSNKKVYSSGENFTIFLEYENKEFDLIIHRDNEILYTDSFWRKSPVVFPINTDGNILFVYMGAGNPTPKYTYFYDVKNNIKSDIFVDANMLNYDYNYDNYFYQDDFDPDSYEPEEKEFHRGREYNDNLVYYLEFTPDENYEETKKGKIRLIIRDIFDKSKFYKEIERDFTKEISLIYAIQKIKMTNDKILYITYEKGQNRELISEEIDLNDL